MALNLNMMYAYLETVGSIRQMEGNLYRIDYRAGYGLDELLARGAKNEKEVIRFISERLFFGWSVKIENKISACTAYAATTPE